MVRRSPRRRASQPARQLPAIVATITRTIATLTSLRFSCSGQAARLDRLYKGNWDQNLDAQCPRHEHEPMRMTRMEIPLRSAWKRSRIAGGRRGGVGPFLRFGDGASDPQGRQEAEEEQLPPGLSDRGEPGEQRIGEDPQA